VDREQFPAFISFVSEVTIVMVSIYLPYRAFQLGAGSWLVGLVGASGSVVYMFAPFLTGRLSDSLGPKRLLVMGTTLITALCLSYTLVSDPMVFVGLRLLEGVGWAMIWPPLEALYSLRGSDLRRSLKMFNLAWGLGAIVAPILGSLVVSFSSVGGTLLLSAALMLAALLMSLTIRGRKPAHPAIKEKARVRLDPFATASLLSYAFVYGLTLTTFSTFFPKYAASLSFEVTLWGTALSAIYAGRLAAFSVSERVMQALGMKRTRTAFLILALCFPLYSVTTNPSAFLLVISSFVTGAGFGFVYSATLVTMLSGPAEGRGRSAGLFESSLGLGSFVGPALAGAIASSGLWLTMVLPVVPIVGVLLTGISVGRELPSTRVGESQSQGTSRSTG
jgi:MFS family permease